MLRTYLNTLLISILLLTISLHTCYAEKPINTEDKPTIINDGPYIFYKNDKLIIKWIKNDFVHRRKIKYDKLDFIQRKFNIELDTIHSSKPINYKQAYSNIDKIIAISDIHGQYNIATSLLRTHKVINQDNNWSYGKGHLVILGDIFDRGDKVTELLWLIYKLENQAEKAGGKVHFLIGNHELMVMHYDLRYIHSKYQKSASMMNLSYSDLFLDNSVLGKWIRSKPVIISINDILFTHAGISPEVMKTGFNKKKINKLFIENIYNKDMMTIFKDSTLNLLFGKYGPLWYRGYYSFDFSEKKIDSVLDYFNVNHIAIGHTSLPNISPIYNAKLLGIDSNIKEGNYGEILIIENNNYYRGTLQGGRIKIY